MRNVGVGLHGRPGQREEKQKHGSIVDALPFGGDFVQEMYTDGTPMT
jgi:hypothetical protein